jgi:thioredoxin 1
VAKPKDVTEETFDSDVLQGSNATPVLVDFWAPWCGPCRIVSPIVEELADEYAGKMVFTKLNVDDAPAIAHRYQVMSIPTLMIFKKGQPLEAVVGARPKRDLKSRVDRALA